MNTPAIERLRPLAGLALLLALTGCASNAVQPSLRASQTFSRSHLGVAPELADTPARRAEMAALADTLLNQPLSADDAVRLALATSPAGQVLLLEQAAASAANQQSLRPANPVFTFERLLRNDAGVRDLDIGRMLTVSLLDLILLPGRWDLAADQERVLRTQAAQQLLDTATEVRFAWVDAVAAQQAHDYARQVERAAQAAAELARRMQSVGNFNTLQRAREQLFYADAAAQRARAEAAALDTREKLIRTLGLDREQAARLTLPANLPDLPASLPPPMDAPFDDRLDVLLARAQRDAQGRILGETRVTRLLASVHLSGVRNSATGQPPQTGYELEIPIPIFDLGDARLSAAEYRYLASAERVVQTERAARSELYVAARGRQAAWQLARHYRDEIVPLAQTISAENQLRYNGMLIGVFELLADAREQIAAVQSALSASRAFWIADAQYMATRLGRKLDASPASLSSPTSPARADAAH
jgi:outer membrane protein TolC